MSTSEEITLHVDNNPKTRLRSQIFGHDGVIIPFREGLIAKKCRRYRELSFYLSYIGWMHDMVPPCFVPKIEGIVDEEDTDKKISNIRSEVRLKMKRDISMPTLTKAPYIMMRDIADGFEKPAFLDIKLGRRTWELGANPEKVERMKRKCKQGTAYTNRFKIRAAMWYSREPGKWPMTDNTNFIKREFGNNCSTEELIAFLRDFFHYREQLAYYIKQLRDLREALMKLRSEANARMFSSSVLLTYDENDPSKKECRILDFAKTYWNIDEMAENFHENLNDCEDDVIPAISNLVNILSSL